eukprot:2317556-Rhodomonas_salina.1
MEVAALKLGTSPLSYAMSGTDTAYATISLRACYAMSGTITAYVALISDTVLVFAACYHSIAPSRSIDTVSTSWTDPPIGSLTFSATAATSTSASSPPLPPTLCQYAVRVLSTIAPHGMPLQQLPVGQYRGLHRNAYRRVHSTSYAYCPTGCPVLTACTALPRAPTVCSRLHLCGRPLARYPLRRSRHVV